MGVRGQMTRTYCLWYGSEHCQHLCNSWLCIKLLCKKLFYHEFYFYKDFSAPFSCFSNTHDLFMTFTKMCVNAYEYKLYNYYIQDKGSLRKINLVKVGTLSQLLRVPPLPNKVGTLIRKLKIFHYFIVFSKPF